MQHNTILQGDALSLLKTLPDACIQMVCTSPPYHGLRSYLSEGHPDKHLEIGLEESPSVYIQKLVEVFREVRRVLRDTGVLWINIGDRFSNDDKWGGSTGGKHVSALHGDNVMRDRRQTGLPPKSLMMLPARFAIAMQDDNWILRSDCIWHKINPMPEPVRDRPSQAHEHVFLFAKNRDYYYDADAVRQPLRPKTYTTFGTKHRPQGNDGMGKVKSDNWGSSLLERKPRLSADGDIAGANLRSVWPLASQSFDGAHYATMPPKLAEICILSGSSPQACEVCHAPWQRVTEHIPMVIRNGPKAGSYGSRTTDGLSGTMLSPAETRTIGWESTCTHENEGTGRCLILDPFAGAGTTLLVAEQCGRDWLGIDLNPEYLQLIRERMAAIQPVLWLP